MKKLAILFFSASVWLAAPLQEAGAQTQNCTADNFSEVVDDTARALRELNADGARRYDAKLREFQERHGLSQEELRQRAASLVDDRMSEFNREIETLVNEMDRLSRTPAEQIDCERLDELQGVRDRLLTVMGQKSGYMLARVETALAQPAPGQETVQREAKSDLAEPAQPPAAEEAEAHQERQTAAQPTAQEASPDLPERRSGPPSRDIANADPEPASSPQEGETEVAAAEPERLEPSPWTPSAAEMPQIEPGAEGETFTIDEIRNAGRGLFGTITAEFAGAINYAFQQFGQPNAYITGSEGGAAFLAGLRYGKGELHLKDKGPKRIFWQGPSLGYDVGAEGSNVLFLVYNLKEQERLYGRFTGIGGAAYIAGGVGVNVLGKGGMVVVPIRTGLGLRIGANLAYLKFTERQTWNPF